jgi:hypothetical protein
VTRTLDLNSDVVGFLLAADFAPSIGQKVFQSPGGILAQLVGSGNLHIQPQVLNFLVVSHRRISVAGRRGIPSARGYHA